LRAQQYIFDVRLGRRLEHGLRGVLMVKSFAFLIKAIMLFDVMRYPNIYKLFAEQVERYQDRNIFYVRDGGEWQGLSWSDFYQEVIDFACALKAFGFTQGKSVCILAGNSPAWPTSDLGTIAAQGVCVGLYPTSSAEQCQYIIAHADAEFVVVDTSERLEKILQVKRHLPLVKKIIALDEALADESTGVMSYKGFLQTGRDNRERFEAEVKRQATDASGEDVAMMVYTSGTTGLPKGACLSHRYVINSALSVVETLGLEATDTAFSYLPFCHVAERIAGFYTRLCAGMAAYFIDDLTKLYACMLEVKPTIFGSLPRFFEKIHARIMADLEQTSSQERAEFMEALYLGRQICRLRQNGEAISAQLQQEQEKTAHHLTRKVKEYTGNVRMMTSGGAPLPLEIGEFFDAAGIPILEAYGLTENVCVAFNRPNHRKFGTVGVAMPGCEIKVADDAEILLRSRMMFSGYYKEPERTAEMFCDGWLLTGDLGEIDERGFLKITGRKKELIITSTGKTIAPLMLENLIREHPLISHAMVYGDGKSYLVALLTLHQVELEEFARARKIDYQNYAALTQNAEITALVQQVINRVNAKVSSTEGLKKFLILDRDLSLEADEVTPTMKVKRDLVAARYKEQLERLYA
jgi:long-chain acyl-CoA synthetase